MTAHGRLSAYAWRGDRPEVVEGPRLARNMFLWRQTANFLLEGLLRQMPFRLDRIDVLTMLGESSDAVVLTFTRDGASANTNCLEWLFDFLRAHGPPNLLPHNQFCCLHRVAIARGLVDIDRPIPMTRASLCFFGVLLVLPSRLWILSHRRPNSRARFEIPEVSA